ncbi:MAG: sugar ABC transporter permease [Alphaproteobacteria bacterium]|nr:sugar ABC transporter permease [Alphaproteobacteria bacterium]
MRRTLRYGADSAGPAVGFIAPAGLVLVLMNVGPLLWSLGISFFHYRADRPHTPPHFVGVHHYFEIATDGDVWERLRHTALFISGSVLMQIVVGSVLALLFYRPFLGRRVVLMLVLAPMLLSMVFVGTFFNFLYDPTFGLVSAAVRLVTGAPFAPLGTPASSMTSLIAADVWMWAPFVMLMLLAGIEGVPSALVEAAEIDRLRGWRRFRSVLWPSVRGALLLALLFRAIESFNQFDLVFTITNGGPGTSTEMLSTQTYGDAFVLFETSRAAALANFGTAVVIVLASLYFTMLRRRGPPERG